MVMKVKSLLRASMGSSSSEDHGRRKKEPKAAAKSSSVLSGIEAALARCTSHHEVAVEDKYVHEILFLVSNAPASVTFLSKRITARLETTRDPVVVLKTLVLLHRLLRGGDRRFEQDMANLWSSGELKMDLSWCSHAFLVSYSSFLEERMGWIINHAGLLEPIRPPRQHEEEEAESVMYRLWKCQRFLDRAMDCLPHETSSCTSQVVMQSAFNIVLRESFRVYDSFCDGVATILSSSFFELETFLTDLALDVLREACTQSPRLHDFYETCKRRSFGKILDYPSVRIITKDQVSSMQLNHLPTEHREHEIEVQETNVEESDQAISRTPFFCKLETKISKVWVEFDEEDSQTCVTLVN